METKWVEDAEGIVNLPFLSGFSIAAMENATLAVQLESSTDAPAGFPGRTVQFALTSLGARQLSAALARAVQLLESSPGDEALN